MFTGIIRAVGQIDSIHAQGGDVRLRVSGDLPWADFEPGESIAVNGACLTATRLTASGFETDVSRETLRVTALGDLRAGSRVNLEPSMALGERLGGHWVSGHVDCIGTIVDRQEDARSWRFEIELPSDYARYIARKGSVTIDGTSLTINDVSGDRFSVNIIPHTAANTLFGDYQAGDHVNIEVDMLMRYVERLLAKDADGTPGISLSKLKEFGYA